jgi:metal-responsive CopG/Arc/MetJ family transcriptional regulator
MESMKTVSYSLDEETAKGIDSIAKKAKLSRSDVVRTMYARMQLEQTFEEMEAQASQLLKKLGLETEDDVAAYAKSKT